MKLCDCAQPDPIGGAYCRACQGVIPLASRGEATPEQWQAYADGELRDFGLDTGRLKGCVRVLAGAVAIAGATWWVVR